MKSTRLTADTCMLCPRGCSAERSAGKTGFCGETQTVRLARAALHLWEEPCISGTRGSGAVFFTGCVLRCVYCQNHEIAIGNAGREVSVERLARIFMEQQEQGANNINLVTPTHFVPQIVQALKLAKKDGLILPVVYNTGSYETVETLRLLDGLIDVYLPDLKYVSPVLSEKYSHAADYFTVASAAISEMVRQVGTPQFFGAEEENPETADKTRFIEAAEAEGKLEAPAMENGRNPETGMAEAERKFESGAADNRKKTVSKIPEAGIMKKGVIVRHLMLPGQIKDSKAVLRYLYETYGNDIYLSIMNQYTPMNGIGTRYPELSRTVRKCEYDRLVDYALSLGIENGFIQEGETAKESFIPAFDYEGV